MPLTITRRLVLSICQVYAEDGECMGAQPAWAASCRLGMHGGVDIYLSDGVS